MAPEFQVLLSGALTFGVPIILGIYELHSLRRDRGGWRPDVPPPPKPLPDCLNPKLAERRSVAQRRPELV